MSQAANEPLESPQGGGVYMEVSRKVWQHLTERENTGKHTWGRLTCTLPWYSQVCT